MSLVFLAERLGDGAPAALKILREELAEVEGFKRRFLREWRYLASLDHPSIVGVRDAGDAGGVTYLVMDYVEGTDLYALLERGPLEPEQALRTLSQVAAALDAAHDGGILHRDVKPGNVLVAGSGDERPPRCYLTDFGLSKQTIKESIQLTAAGDFVGTIAYTAPEEMLGRDLDARVDVYSLGCLLFECLTGKPPYTGSEVEVMQAHIQSPPPKLPKKRTSLPAALNDVFRKALAKDPADRYASCRELVEAAATALGMPDAARPPGVPVTGELILEVLEGNAAGSAIHVGSDLVIARGAEGDGGLADDLEISRRHARIARDPSGRFEVVDLGSTNGTFVNGRRIAAPEALSVGDTIELGETKMVVRTGSPPSAEPEMDAALSLVLQLDFEAREALLEIEGSSEPIRLVAVGASWRPAAYRS
jgi:serine/threonine protein kinase